MYQPPHTRAFRTTATGGLDDPGADLGVLPGRTKSSGNGINALGEVVGSSHGGVSPASHAFLYTDRMWDLNDLIAPGTGWVLGNARGVNDNLWIVGDGYLNGIRSGFLLIPNTTDPTAMRSMLYTPVPEPSAFALTGAAAAIGLLRRRRRRRG
jgi:probable HAF family extracellular repeat protein